jgi:hypothetical protein
MSWCTEDGPVHSECTGQRRAWNLSSAVVWLAMCTREEAQATTMRPLPVVGSKEAGVRASLPRLHGGRGALTS